MNKYEFIQKYHGLLASHEAIKSFVSDLESVVEDRPNLKGYNIYICPDCGWMTRLKSGQGICECEYCNQSNQDSLKLLFNDATAHFQKNFFKKMAWTKPIIETIIHKVGDITFVFEIKFDNADTALK